MTDYLLESRGGSMLLRVVTSGFPTDATWDEWVEGTNLGWMYELRSLKHYLERHDGKGRAVAYVRRRVRITPAAAWSRLFGAGGLGADALAGERVHEVADRFADPQVRPTSLDRASSATALPPRCGPARHLARAV